MERKQVDTFGSHRPDLCDNGSGGASWVSFGSFVAMTTTQINKGKVPEYQLYPDELGSRRDDLQYANVRCLTIYDLTVVLWGAMLYPGGV